MDQVSELERLKIIDEWIQELYDKVLIDNAMVVPPYPSHQDLLLETENYIKKIELVAKGWYCDSSVYRGRVN